MENKADVKQSRALRPDTQAFDEIRIVTVPRYKMSGLSGDEWRISARTEFWRKGKLICSTGCRNIETACGLLMAKYYEACDDGKAYYAGVDDICDQEGCAEKATVTYRVKKEFSRDNPHVWNRPATGHSLGGESILVRRFCAAHGRRGDCGFDDSDSNYELIEGSVAEPPPSSVNPSRLGGVIIVDPEDA